MQKLILTLKNSGFTAVTPKRINKAISIHVYTMCLLHDLCLLVIDACLTNGIIGQILTTVHALVVVIVLLTYMFWENVNDCIDHRNEHRKWKCRLYIN